MKKHVQIAALLITLTGCGLTYSVLLGVDTTPQWLFNEDIERRIKQYSLPVETSFVLDTSSAFRIGIDSIYKRQLELFQIQKSDSSELKLLKGAMKDDLQPTQIRLFDNNGEEVFKLVNCYVDPPIPMDWNVDNCFDSFPPKTSIESLNKHLLNLEFLFKHTRRLDGRKVLKEDLPRHDYYCVVVWNDYFKRPSKRLIKTTKEYVKRTNESILVLYINNHNQYLWSVMDAPSKKKVSQALAEDAL